MKYLIMVLAVVAVFATGCRSTRGGDVIDGWPVGAEVSCTPDRRCPELIDAAIDGLDRRDPGHPAIGRVVLHGEGLTYNANGDAILHLRSGSCCLVARFQLADGSVRAIGVGFPGISTTPVTFDYGP